MLRALILFALVIGIVLGGLMLLRRTRDTGVPRPGNLPRKRIRGPEQDEKDDEGSGW